MTEENTTPSGTSPPPRPTNRNTPDALSAFASATMASLSSSSDPDGTTSIDPVQAAPAADVPSASDHECANCGSLATQRCTGCDHGVKNDGTKSSPTHYCGKDCQRDHWTTTQQRECKLAIDRRQLFELGRLVQWAFYASTKAMWSDGILDIQKVEDPDDVHLRVQRYQKHDLPDFPSFPESGFTGYGGVLEDGDEQAVLATSARGGAVVCGLLDELIQAYKSRIQVEAVTFDPMAYHYRSVSFVPGDGTPIGRPSSYWIFRATFLRSGSRFALDPCNSQYKCTTSEERKCGVFKWGLYLHRLSSIFFQFPSGTDIQGFRSHVPRNDVYPVGNIEDAQKNIFVDTDVRCTAEMMASSCLYLARATLPLKTKLSLKELMAHTTSDVQHAKDVKTFKAHVQEFIRQGRAKGIKDLLLQRLEHKGSALLLVEVVSLPPDEGRPSLAG